MNPNLFYGKLVRLTAEDPATIGAAMAGWDRDSEYHRLLDNDPARLRSTKKMQAWCEQDMEKETPQECFFQIRTLQGDRLIGFIGLFGLDWANGDTWVGIGLGERDCWGQGYGTDAMRTILRYAFHELNLHRVTLGVFEYNPRGMKSYEKAGFRLEGRQRQALGRDGRRYDLFIMGILRDEWQKTLLCDE